MFLGVCIRITISFAVVDKIKIPVVLSFANHNMFGT